MYIVSIFFIKMQLRQLIHSAFSYIPLKSIVFIFILWSNSSYAPVIRNVGFFCDDESIKQPFHGDSVHFICLLTVLLGLFPFIIYFTEVLSKTSKKEDEFPKYHLRLLLRNYYSGFLFVLGFTEFLKLSYSELRPHFLTTCDPDMKNIKCSDGYITQFNCTGKGRAFLLGRDIYKSFPSGHASASLFSFVFLNIYLSSRMKNAPKTAMCQWWSQSIPMVTFVWTLICCISRIIDNRHFWWDVLVGVFIGLVGGLITVKMALKTSITEEKHSKSNIE